MIYLGRWRRRYDHRQLQDRAVATGRWLLGRRDSSDSSLLRIDGVARSSARGANKAFAMIADEYRDKGLSFPADSTESLHA